MSWWILIDTFRLFFFFCYETSCFLKTEMDLGLLSLYHRKEHLNLNILSIFLADGMVLQAEKWLLGQGTSYRFGTWVHKLNSLWLLINEFFVALEGGGRSSTSSFHWLVLCIYAHLQMKLLLVNGFIGSCTEKTMSGPGMCSVTTSLKLGHIKVAAFISELTCYTKSSAYPKQKTDVFLRPCTGVHFCKPIQCDPRKEVLLMTSSQRGFQLAFPIPFWNQILLFLSGCFFLLSLPSITSHKLSPCSKALRSRCSSLKGCVSAMLCVASAVTTSCSITSATPLAVTCRVTLKRWGYLQAQVSHTD